MHRGSLLAATSPVIPRQVCIGQTMINSDSAVAALHKDAIRWRHVRPGRASVDAEQWWLPGRLCYLAPGPVQLQLTMRVGGADTVISSTTVPPGATIVAGTKPKPSCG